MHHDPLLSSKALKVFSWGHDWVVLALLIRLPAWAPTKVFALAIAFRLHVNRQGLARGKKKTRSLVVLWFDSEGPPLCRIPWRPWYRRKREPSFQDMVSTLRRLSWEAKIGEVVPVNGPQQKWVAEVTEWMARAG